MGIFGAAFVGGLAITALRRMPWWWAAASAGAALAWRQAAQKRLRREDAFDEAETSATAAATLAVEPSTAAPPLVVDTHLVQRWSPAYFSAPLPEEDAEEESAPAPEAPSPAIELASELTHDLRPPEPIPPHTPPSAASPWVLTVEPVPAWQDPEPAAPDTTSSDLLTRAPEGVEESETARMESAPMRTEPATQYLPPISTGADLPDEILISSDPMEAILGEDLLPQIAAEPAPASFPEPLIEPKPTIRPTHSAPQKVLLRVPTRVTPKSAEPAPEPVIAGSSGPITPEIPPAPVVIPRQNPIRKKSWLGWWK